MVHFTKISLAGFKSFCDPYDVDIMPGLTGVVGPNGCGKSNLVEALRWIMGENSAKRMRGSEMDDVIFAGTGTRAPRNHAEVRLVLDNRGRQAPEIFNKDDTLEITRRIERGKGSNYRVNGKIVRARDIQMLFADTATGANSPAIVSQGRVSDIIHAKPTDRRQILEDAAAISGLNTRRKEAEQRLKSAETNLERVSDVIDGKEKAYQDLRKQARQAIKYRDLSSALRKIEAALTYREWQDSQQAQQKAQDTLKQTHESLEKQKVVIFDIKKKRDSMKETVERLQNRSMTIQTKLSSIEREKENVQEQLAQIDKAVSQTQGQIEQINTDIAHENKISEEAQNKAALLKEEKENLKALNDNFESDLESAMKERDHAMAEMDKIQETVGQENTDIASHKTRINHLTKQTQELESALAQLNEKLSGLETEKETLQAKLDEAESIKDLQTNVSKAEKALKNAQEKAAQVEKDKGELSNQVASARTHYQTLESRVTKLIAETETLTTLLENHDDSDFPAVLNDVKVEDGFEKALSVALGDDLKASMEKDAPVLWNNIGWLPSSLPKLPTGLECIQDYVTAPKALQAALSQIGVSDDAETAMRFVKSLKPGQWVVSKDGGAWRWDGYTIKPGQQASTSHNIAAVRLEQRNRLDRLNRELIKADKDFRKGEDKYKELVARQDEMNSYHTHLQGRVSEAYASLDKARTHLSKTQQHVSDLHSQIRAMDDKIQHFTGLKEKAAVQLKEAQKELAAAPAIEDSLKRLENLKEVLEEKRRIYRLTQERYTQIKSEDERRKQRMGTIDNEYVEWTKRQRNSESRSQVLEKRLSDAITSLEQLQSKPAELKERRETLNGQSAALQTEEKTFLAEKIEKQDSLNIVENQLGDAEEIQIQLREDKARSEASYDAANAQMEQIQARAEKHFNGPIDEMPAKMELDEELLSKDVSKLEAENESLQRSRERLGAINLRAEQDAKILFEELENLTQERDDITHAIDELRQAISKLNSDARRRLMSAFEEVNKHFTEIFERLFGGGQAYLQLTNADDPLEAGLEIYASPPGKKLQNLSLLSGGEQSLTSIALIFAMFRTTPSPICILDEIDAPLDDANVTRICELLQDFTKECDTRFIIITHNAITMSRMHRLYGVTMAEKGVSKLVSVDLEKHIHRMDGQTYSKEMEAA